MKEEKLNHMPHSEGRYTDPLDFALAARPVVKAPSGTSQKVLARLAILEQQKQSVITAATTQVKYAPPAVLPLPEPEEEEPELSPSNPRLGFFIFAFGWVSLLLSVAFLAWFFVISPLIQNSTDNLLLNWLVTLAGGINNFFAVAGPFLPGVFSLIAGLGIMLAIFRIQQRDMLFE
jgi:hypothetical protein